jgi:hypothetical protein
VSLSIDFKQGLIYGEDESETMMSGDARFRMVLSTDA